MDIASILGFFAAFALIIGSIMIGTCPVTAFIDIPSILIVFGGAGAAVILSFPLKTALSAPMVLKKVFFNRTEDVRDLIEQLVSLAETARRDGLLALEGRLEEIDNDFIILGIQMAVDGTRPEVIQEILQTEIDALAARHRTGKGIIDLMGKYTPAYGMIGTLLGLIMMLSNMSDPSTIGSGMAVALITTLYGAIAANACCLPFADKLSFISKQELLAKEVILRGIMAIQSGENPRVIGQKLSTFLPPKLRTLKEQEAA